jgi:membrane-associated phospholipid phosphatase
MNLSVKRPLAGWFACVVALIGLTLAAYGVDPFQRLDASALSRFAAHQASSFGLAAEFFAHLADPLPLLAILAGICALGLYWGRPRQVLAAVAVVAGANLTTQILKVALAHPRFQPVLGSHQLGPVAFPSGHATAAASVAVALLLVTPWRWRPLAFVAGAGFVAAVGCSVLVLSWHYPSDVLGGILVASAWGFAALACLNWAEQLGELRRPAQVSSRAAISVK